MGSWGNGEKLRLASVARSLETQGFSSVPGCPQAVFSQEREKTTGYRLIALCTNSKSSKFDFSIRQNGLGVCSLPTYPPVSSERV